jgi:hypothetical protein
MAFLYCSFNGSISCLGSYTRLPTGLVRTSSLADPRADSATIEGFEEE